jgi:hypothetical protein
MPMSRAVSRSTSLLREPTSRTYVTERRSSHSSRV